MAADAVVDLPGEQRRVVAQILGDGADDLLGVGPVGLAVQAVGVARAGMERLALLVHRQDLGMLLGQPERRSGGGRGEDDPDSVGVHQVHRALHPGEVELPFLGFDEAPDELAHAHGVHAGRDHELHVLFPAGFTVLWGSSIGIDPMLRMVVDAEEHRFGGG